MNILLTGGNGFIGKNILEQLQGKYKIIVPSHRELDLLKEIAVEKFIIKNKIDIILHCAVVGGSRVEERVDDSLEQNLRMFFSITRNAKIVKKIIHIGSGTVYNKHMSLKMVKEDDLSKTIPNDEYGFYKYISARYIDLSSNILDLRVFGLYGKYEDYRYRFISNEICRNLYGLPMRIRQDVYFDYVYINDFVRIIEHFMNHKSHFSSYNIGTGKPINIVAIAKKINEISDKPTDIIIKKKGFGKEYTCNAARLKKELGSFQFTDFSVSLKELYSWYVANLVTIDKNLL